MSYEKALEKIKQAEESGATELNLLDTHLKCLPPEIGQLSNLQHLELSLNPRMTLPPEIGQLFNLEYLALSGNRLTTLPPEIGQLTHLQHLLLSGNRLTTLPPEIGQLTHMVRLELNGNQLAILLPEIGQLTHLQQLDLGGNQLTSLPVEFSRLTHLNTLDLSRNPLQSWPERGPAKLERLILNECHQLKYLPNWLEQIRELEIGDCEQLSKLPDQLRIAVIELADTAVTALPAATEPNVEIYWRGVLIDQRIVFEPETITVQEVFAETNLEVRRVMMERMGHEKFIREANAEEIDNDIDAGGVRRLLRVELPDGQGWRQQAISDEPFVGLEVRDPSTGRQYILRVPPDMETCHQAAAWIAGFDDPDDYRPVQET